MKIAVVGATGLVGTKMLEILAERNFPVTELLAVASEKTVGKTVAFKGEPVTVIGIQTALEARPDIALFSAGGETSLAWAPKFAAIGTTVIDNSSAWRMNPENKLIVPEVNAGILTIDDKIIANPNCSTIQMVLVLKPLHDKYKIKRVIVSTYQSVTGTGVKAVQQMVNERQGITGEMAYPHKIDMNAIPQVDVFTENGYTKEEMKMLNETRKILSDDSIKLSATCVRIPTIGGHSESLNIEFEKEINLDDIRKLLDDAPGLEIQDDPANNIYPMALTAHNSDLTYVGRLRRDDTVPNGINCWVVSDNLRKGAATNAVQIAEYLVENKLV